MLSHLFPIAPLLLVVCLIFQLASSQLTFKIREICDAAKFQYYLTGVSKYPAAKWFSPFGFSLICLLSEVKFQVISDDIR